MKNPEVKVTSNLKHWIKKKGFQIQNLPGLNLTDVLGIPKANPDGTETFQRLVHVNQLHDTLKQIYIDQLKHSGYKKVLSYAAQHYFGIHDQFEIMNVDRQPEQHSSTYSLAFAASLAHGDDPVHLSYINPRQHILTCLEVNNISQDEDNYNSTEDYRRHIYTLQRHRHWRRDDLCDGCDKWYHNSCTTNLSLEEDWFWEQCM